MKIVNPDKLSTDDLSNDERINTKESADILRVDSNTIRRSLCVNGHYLDIKPLKLQNGRLLWPKKEIYRLAGRKIPINKK